MSAQRGTDLLLLVPVHVVLRRTMDTSSRAMAFKVSSLSSSAAESFWQRLPFARPPEITIMAPGQIDTISDATELLVDQQDVTPLGLAFQAIELQTSEDVLDAALRRVLRAMKV